MSEAFKKYQEFGWATDPKWCSYRDNIYPVPAAKQFEKIRRKWYKKNVNPDFDVDYDPDAPQS